LFAAALEAMNELLSELIRKDPTPLTLGKLLKVSVGFKYIIALPVAIFSLESLKYYLNIHY
jgi:hypothetical protein